MIIADKNAPIEKSGMGKESLFNIKEENVAHIFSILRNQLYSDKLLAIVREYITNAIDAHVEANVEKPISITMPTLFSKELVIRDYGKGLSPEDIVEIFASYGASTKRQSNSYTGMLGIGSKSAFAYTDSFTIISRHEGIETTYQAYIDETNVGTIATVHSKTTDETGLSIHIHIAKDDFSRLQDKMVEFFSFIDYRPEFVNYNVAIPKHKITTSGTYWKFVETKRRHWHYEPKIYFVMGNVTYISDIKEIKSQINIDLSLLQNLARLDLVVDVPIGSIKPSASRESLEFNELTKQFIFKALYNIRIELIEKLRDDFGNCSNKWERHCIAFHFDELFHSIMPSDISRYIYAVHKDTFGITDIKMVTSDLLYPFPKDKVYLTRNTVFVMYDESKKITYANKRVSDYAERMASPEQVKYAILKFKNKKDIENFKKHSSFIGATFIDLESLPKPATVQTVYKSQEAEVYEFVRISQHNVTSWVPAKTPPPSDAVYLEISSFKPKHYEENRYINNVLDDLDRLRIPFPKIYGVKTADLKKTVQPTWIEFKDYIINQIIEWKKKNPDDVRDYEYFMEVTNFQKDLITYHPTLSYLDSHMDNFNKKQTLFDIFQANVEKIFKLDVFKSNPPKELGQIYDKYPYLNAFRDQMNLTEFQRLLKYLDMS